VAYGVLTGSNNVPDRDASAELLAIADGVAVPRKSPKGEVETVILRVPTDTAIQLYI
jgi:hypothetical protein